METINKIPCTLKINKVKEMKDLIPTELFPILELDPKDVEFKMREDEDRVRVYVKGEHTLNITRLQRARFVEIEENTIPQLSDDGIID